jgi:hypothetical protein
MLFYIIMVSPLDPTNIDKGIFVDLSMIVSGNGKNIFCYDNLKLETDAYITGNGSNMIRYHKVENGEVVEPPLGRVTLFLESGTAIIKEENRRAFLLRSGITYTTKGGITFSLTKT